MVGHVERAEATLGREQGGEGRGDEVSDLHGELLSAAVPRWVWGEYKRWAGRSQHPSTTFFI
jgi:hypothetical protein